MTLGIQTTQALELNKDPLFQFGRQLLTGILTGICSFGIFGQAPQ